MTQTLQSIARLGLGLTLVLSQWICAPDAQAGLGISTRFVDVVLEHVEVGKVYNLRQLRNVPYTVRNRSTAAMDIGVEVLIPSTKDVVNGYEAIPDPTWVRVVPNKLRVEAGATGFAEMIIQVPDDPKYVGRHYQAKVRAKTLDSGMFVVQTESRMRFSTGAGPEALKKERQKMAMLSLDFDITPETLFVDGVKPGVPFNVKKEGRKTMKVTNRAETPIKIKFLSVPYDNARFPIQGDYTPAPDPSWLQFKPVMREIEAETIESLEPVITIPADEAHYGKQYVFMVKADIVMGVDLEVFNTIYVKVQEKTK